MNEQVAQPERFPWRILVFAMFVIIGVLFVASATTAQGSDLRPAGGSVVSLLATRASALEDQQQELAAIEDQITQLSAGSSSSKEAAAWVESVAALSPQVGLTAVTGPGLRVTLNDAPYGLEVPGVDPNALVVHQQDLQSVVNALWAGGAEAVTLQGQRLVATTAIKCVGSTVVLNGVPYSPPYVIEAVGNTQEMKQSLTDSPAVRVFSRYAERFDMGYEVESTNRIFAPAFSGNTSLRFAEVTSD